MSLVGRGLAKIYGTRSGAIAAVEDVSLEVGPGEFLCVVGPSGCGKTTLLKLLAGLVTPTAGTISFDGPGERPHTALVFQEDGLFPWLTVLDNVALGLERLGLRRRERTARAGAMLGRMGLGGFLRNHPHELSVGMRQRANLARAFVSEPSVLLLDEPFGALDAQTRLLMQEELVRLWEEQPRPVVYVTHDIREAVLLGDRVLVLTGRPARVREEVAVALPRPRDLAGESRPELAGATERIWKLLEDDVRRALPGEP